MRRSLRTRWDLLKPSISSRVYTRQNKMKEGHDQHAKMRVFEVGKSGIFEVGKSGIFEVGKSGIFEVGKNVYLME